MIIHEKYKLCRGFFIPEGWRVLKNNIFNVNPNVLDDIERDSDEYFELEDQVFYGDVYIANAECFFTPEMIKIHTSVSISCCLDFNEELNAHSAIFSVEISMIEQKNSEEFFNEIRGFNNVNEAISFVSDLMESYVFCFIPNANELISLSLNDLSSLAASTLGMIGDKNKVKTYRVFSVPSGWCVSKNLFFDVNPSAANDIIEDGKMHLINRAKCFDEDLFLSEVECFYHPISTSIHVAVSIHCVCQEQNINNHELYKSTISIMMKHKNRELNFIKGNDFLSIEDAVESSNEFMEKYTYSFRNLLNGSGLNIDKLYDQADNVFNR